MPRRRGPPKDSQPAEPVGLPEGTTFEGNRLARMGIELSLDTLWDALLDPGSKVSVLEDGTLEEASASKVRMCFEAIQSTLETAGWRRLCTWVSSRGSRARSQRSNHTGLLLLDPLKQVGPPAISVQTAPSRKPIYRCGEQLMEKA
jgi:hypothetical protein